RIATLEEDKASLQRRYDQLLEVSQRQQQIVLQVQVEAAKLSSDMKALSKTNQELLASCTCRANRARRPSGDASSAGPNMGRRPSLKKT
ncbi:hypothetical protein HDU76_012160, partial [Blyttiomyces sp. JEL0837]